MRMPSLTAPPIQNTRDKNLIAITTNVLIKIEMQCIVHSKCGVGSSCVCPHEPHRLFSLFWCIWHMVAMKEIAQASAFLRARYHTRLVLLHTCSMYTTHLPIAPFTQQSYTNSMVKWLLAEIIPRKLCQYNKETLNMAGWWISHCCQC